MEMLESKCELGCLRQVAFLCCPSHIPILAQDLVTKFPFIRNRISWVLKIMLDIEVTLCWKCVTRRYLTIQGSLGIPTDCEVMFGVGKHAHLLVTSQDRASNSVSFESVYAGNMGPPVMNLII